MGNCQKDQQPVLDGVMRNGPVQEIRVTNFTWTKDYQGLFDYESTSIQKKKIKITRNRLFAKDNGEIITYEDESKKLKEEEMKHCLFRLIKKEHYYQINPVVNEDQNYATNKMLWLVTKSIPGQSYKIQEKDILKLGKQRIRVRELVHFDPNPSMVMDFDHIQVSKTIYEDLTIKTHIQLPEGTSKHLKIQQSGDKNEVMSVATENQQVCRICLDPGEKTNPLITPCKCSGSVKFIHLKCLRTWLNKRLQTTKSTHFMTINWQVLSCEMCKSNFKYRIYMDNKKFYTVEIPKPPKPYLVLEVVKKNNNVKGKLFHFVSLAAKSKVSLGRRKDIDVRISEDISVSRNHASISYNEATREFFLTDNKSKFGTLVLIRKSLLVRPQNSGISLQVGAEVFTFDTVRQEGGPEQLNVPGGYFLEDWDDDEEMEEADDAESDGEYNQEMDNELASELQSPEARRGIHRQLSLPS